MSIIENAMDRLRRTGASPAPIGPRKGRFRLARPRPVDMRVPPPETAPNESRQQISIDLDALRAQDELPESGQERRFADYYREIKRPLIERAFAADAPLDSRLVLVTSGLPAEGKTFTALNLALSIARERDVSVLLVDADLPKAHLSCTFGIDDRPGLLDALTDPALDVESLVLGTSITGLEVLPAGRGPESMVAELVASVRMAEVAERLTEGHPRRVVLFDSAPLLLSSEARALKQLPGQILMVARAGKTPRQALLDALAMLDHTKVHAIVLNEAYTAGQQDYYDYYGYSQYSVDGHD